MATVEHLLAHFTELEQQLQQVREGLTHSHRLATLGTIATIIAHEFNNILTPMVSYAQLALAAPDDRELMKKAVEKGLAGSQRAAAISASLLGFAREADQQHVAALPKTIDEAVHCLAREPRKDGIDLVVDVPDVLVAISPLNLEQVLVNLLLNAKQAMRRTGGQVRISAQVQGNLVQLQVADSGPGIPMEIRDRLFEPFVTRRLDDGAAEVNPAGKAATTPGAAAARPGSSSTGGPGGGKGTGLGLCICRDLIRSAGGAIRFDSEPGQGTIFHITLPLADDIFRTPTDGDDAANQPA